MTWEGGPPGNTRGPAVTIATILLSSCWNIIPQRMFKHKICLLYPRKASCLYSRQRPLFHFLSPNRPCAITCEEWIEWDAVREEGAHHTADASAHRFSQFIGFQSERWLLVTRSQLPDLPGPLSYTYYPWNEFKSSIPQVQQAAFLAPLVTSMSVPVTFVLPSRSVPHQLTNAHGTPRTPFPRLLQSRHSGSRIP